MTESLAIYVQKGSLLHGLQEVQSACVHCCIYHHTMQLLLHSLLPCRSLLQATGDRGVAEFYPDIGV